MGSEPRPTDPLLVVPTAWEQTRQRAARSAAVPWVIVLIFLVLGTFALSLGNYAVAVTSTACMIFGLATVFGGYFLALVPWRRGSTGVRLAGTRCDSSACVMAYAAGPRNAFYGLMAALLVMFMLVPIGTQAVPVVSTLRDIRIHAIGPFVPILAAYPAVMLATAFVRRRRYLGLGLGADGIYSWGWLGCRFVPWEGLAGIRAVTAGSPRIALTTIEPPTRQRNEEENWITRTDVFRRRTVSVIVAYLDVHPNVVYYALWFYRRHPELRPELATEAGLERIKQMDFPDVIAEVREHGDILTRAAALRRRYLGL
jgi:hypothetical protein